MSSSLLERLSPRDSTGVALLLVGAVTGFFLGRASITQQSSAPVRTGPIELLESDESESELESESDTEIAQSSTNPREECKLVLVVRTDLGMTKGKIAAQCGHATLACYKAHLRQEGKSNPTAPSILRRWESMGQAKIAVQIKSEDDMLMLQAQAISLGLSAKVIHDAGRTQIASGSATVLGVGPGPKSLVDQVTGHLKLL